MLKRRWKKNLAVLMILAMAVVPLSQDLQIYADEIVETEEGSEAVLTEAEISEDEAADPESVKEDTGCEETAGTEDTTWQEDWEYTTDSSDPGNKKIILSKIKSTASTDVVIPATAVSGGQIYHTVLKVGEGEDGNILYILRGVHITSFCIDPGVKLDGNSLNEMFMYQDRLETVSMEGLDVSGIKYLKSMFNLCTRLKTLKISSWDTGSVINMCNMLQDCYSLSCIDLGSWKTGNVEDMSCMFQCGSVKSINVKNWNTSKVRKMNGMFGYCESLSSIDLSGWNTENVEDMDNMFYNCTTLKNIVTGTGWNTRNVGQMKMMFRRCIALESINVRGWNTENLKRADSIFEGCSSLSSVDLSGWNTEKLEGADRIFYGCSSLSSVDLSGWDLSKMTALDLGCEPERICTPQTAPEKLQVDGYYLPSANAVNVDPAKMYAADRAVDVSNTWIYKPYLLNYMDGRYSSLSEEKVIPRADAGSLHAGTWYRDYELTESADLSSVSENMNLYQYFGHTVSFDSMGGTAVSSQEVRHGECVSEPAAPAKESCDFEGWFKYYDESSSIGFYFGEPITSDITLYAKWRRYVVITYKSISGETLFTEKVTYDTNADYLHDDYVWYISADKAKKADLTKVSENMTVYGEKKPKPDPKPEPDPQPVKKVYKVEFRSNGEKFGKDQEVEPGGTATEPSEKPAKEGYEFVGWVYRGSLWNFNTPVTFDLTLEAKFVEKTPAAVSKNTGSGMDPVAKIEGKTIYLVKGQSYTAGTSGWSVKSGGGITVAAATGKITAKKKGHYLVMHDGETISVNVAAPQFESRYKNKSVMVGDTAYLALNINAETTEDAKNFPVTWASSNPKAATINGGYVTALAKGNVTIYAYAGGKTYSTKLTVTDTFKAPAKQTGSYTSIKMNPLQSMNLKYDGSVFTIKGASWSGDGMESTSKNGKADGGYKNSVVSITKTGKITAIGNGSTSITGKDAKNREVTVDITVVNVPANASLFVNKGKTATLKFANIKNNNKAVTWKSSAPDIVSMGKNGKVKGEKAGSSVITCSYNGFEFTTRVYVEDPAFESDSTLKKDGNKYILNLNTGDIYNRVKMKDVFQTVNLKSSKPAAVFIDENGVIYARKKGKANITAKINGKTCKIAVTVTDK